MTNREAVNWLINISADIGKAEHRDLWHYEQALYEIREMLEDVPDTNVGKISRQAAIDVNGLDEEIRCEMCKNTMHTDRGCDGNCRYDEKLYKKIIQILDKRINPLPSAQPEIIRCKDCKHHSHDAGYGYDWCNRTSGVFRVKPDDFCSRAERRTDESD